MIGYETEEQQVQAIKQFWKDNGMAIIAGAVIGLGLLWGWRFYNDSQIAAKEEASAAYNTSIESLVKDENNEKLSAFITEQKDTGYAPLAAMILAQKAVEKEDYEGAKSVLETAIAGDNVIADIARLRLANLHLELNETDQALAVLDSVESASFTNQVEELKGDALLAKGDFDGAQNAYTLAMAQSPNNPSLKMKRDNIAFAKTQVTGGDVE
ncbi:MAG: putative negative regulator of RcsB-dependent stress response [Alphaproteobacteria bacterium]|jgi:predicted negative regulator of RcsB-dependent stress response